jgi:hypothetical protein
MWITTGFDSMQKTNVRSIYSCIANLFFRVFYQCRKFHLAWRCQISRVLYNGTLKMTSFYRYEWSSNFIRCCKKIVTAVMMYFALKIKIKNLKYNRICKNMQEKYLTYVCGSDRNIRPLAGHLGSDIPSEPQHMTHIINPSYIKIIFPCSRCRSILQHASQYIVITVWYHKVGESLEM